MASDKKSFADLVKEAPAAPAAGTASLAGALAQSSEAGKFVLTLQDRSAVTLETAPAGTLSALQSLVPPTGWSEAIRSGGRLPGDKTPWPDGATNPGARFPGSNFWSTGRLWRCGYDSPHSFGGS